LKLCSRTALRLKKPLSLKKINKRTGLTRLSANTIR
jgi:hypothetical protein